MTLIPPSIPAAFSLREKDSKLRVWKGKARAAGTRMYQIWFQDILPIVRIACDSSYFTILGRVFAQQRGAAIGNQISPVLASISIAYLEHTWYSHHEKFLLSVLKRSSFAYGMWTIALFSSTSNLYIIPHFSTFYMMTFTSLLYNSKQSTHLESNVNSWALIFRFLPTYAVEMIMTKDRWRFRLPSSLQSGFRSTSLFQSRTANIRKYAWPLSRRDFSAGSVGEYFSIIFMGLN